MNKWHQLERNKPHCPSVMAMRAMVAPLHTPQPTQNQLTESCQEQEKPNNKGKSATTSREK